MRAVVAFVVTFVASIALLVWLSEEMRVLPRGPGWLLLCFALAAFSARAFGKGGKADQLGATVASAVADRVAPFRAPDATDEGVWARVASEFDSEQRRPGLYAKALAAANGDENRAKANYRKARVAEIKASEP